MIERPQTAVSRRCKVIFPFNLGIYGTHQRKPIGKWAKPSKFQKGNIPTAYEKLV